MTSLGDVASILALTGMVALVMTAVVLLIGEVMRIQFGARHRRNGPTQPSAVPTAAGTGARRHQPPSVDDRDGTAGSVDNRVAH